jgi:hypothetical protein
MPMSVQMSSQGGRMPLNAFRRGFLDGWSSIRDSEPAPTIPACSVEPGDDPYQAGFARGVQEACAGRAAAWLINAPGRIYKL